MNRLRNHLSIILIIAMIFTSNAMFVYAGSIDNDNKENITTETTIVETTTMEQSTIYENTDGSSSDNVWQDSSGEDNIDNSSGEVYEPEKNTGDEEEPEKDPINEDINNSRGAALQAPKEESSGEDNTEDVGKDSPLDYPASQAQNEVGSGEATDNSSSEDKIDNSRGAASQAQNEVGDGEATATMSEIDINIDEEDISTPSDTDFISDVLVATDSEIDEMIPIIPIIIATDSETDIATVSQIFGASPVDNTIWFGLYPQNDTTGAQLEPIKWRVLSQDGNEALLISDKIIDARQIHTNTSYTWATSQIRTWLNSNSNFYGKAFNTNLKSGIKQKTISNPNNPTHGTSGGNDTIDNIFLLSYIEAQNLFSSDNDRKAVVTNYYSGTDSYKGWWWLRTPGYNVIGEYVSAYAHLPINAAGTLNLSTSYGGEFVDSVLGIRPAMYIDLTKDMFKSSDNSVTWDKSDGWNFKSGSALWDSYDKYQGGQTLPVLNNLENYPTDKEFLGWCINNDITVAYTEIPIDQTGDIELSPVFATPVSISVSSPSSISSFVDGDSFNPAGLVINVHYDNSYIKKVSYESDPTAFTFTPSPLTAGLSQVTIEYGGFTTTQDITVVPKVIAEILEVTGLPGQTPTEPSFIEEGDTIVLTGVTIKVRYNNNEEDTISYDPTNPPFEFLPNTTATTETIYKVKIGEVEKELDDSILYIYKSTDGKTMNSITGPTKTVYIEGELFDPAGINVNITNFDGNSATVPYNDYNKPNFHFDPSDTTPLAFGTTEVNVQYGNYDGCSMPVNIIVLKRAQTIEILSGTIKDYYDDGDVFDNTCINSLQFTVTYPDTTTDTITYASHPEYFTFEPAFGTTLTSANDKIVIKYAGATLNYPILVEPTTNPTSISINTPATKTNYIAGEAFDPTGLIITATYPGGITKQIPYNADTEANFTFDPDITTETLAYGDTQVTVIYKGATTTQPVTVRKQVTEITQIVSPPTNTEYSKGDKFDPTGLVVKVKYNDDTTEDIPYNSTTKDLFTFTPSLDHTFDNTDVGDKVEVSIGGVTPVTIANMSPVYTDSVAIVDADPAGTTIVKHNITRDEFIQALEDAISNGAVGFHEFNADGIKDAKGKYNKYTPQTLTKDEAIAKYDEYMAGLTRTMFIAATYVAPTPAPAPSGGDSGNGSGGGGISYDANGNIQPGLPNNQQQEALNPVNTIPQNKLINDNNIINNLQSYQENIDALYINARDDRGNKGFGRWQHIPNTTTWYFLSGDFNNTANQKGTVGLLCDGWYNLGWKGKDEWYHFDKAGTMQMGWFTENNKIYYLETDISSNWYGRMITGQYNINGHTYTFDSTGVLIQ